MHSVALGLYLSVQDYLSGYPKSGGYWHDYAVERMCMDVEMLQTLVVFSATEHARNSGINNEEGMSLSRDLVRILQIDQDANTPILRTIAGL